MRKPKGSGKGRVDAKPVAQAGAGVHEIWKDAAALMKRSPGAALGLAGMGGVVTGLLLSRMSSGGKNPGGWFGKAVERLK